MCCFFSADIEDLVSPVALSNRFVVSLHFEGMYHLRLQGSKSLWSMKIEMIHPLKMSGISNPAVKWYNTGDKNSQNLVTFNHANWNRESIFCSWNVM